MFISHVASCNQFIMRPVAVDVFFAEAHREVLRVNDREEMKKGISAKITFPFYFLDAERFT